MTAISNEIDFYRRQCDELGRRVVQLVEEQARARIAAKRVSAVAKIIREAYPLTKMDASLDVITNRFLQTVINTTGMNSVMTLRYDSRQEMLVVDHALGLSLEKKSTTLPPELLKEFCYANSNATSDPLVGRLRTAAGVPYFLFAFHRESGYGLLLGNKIEDRNLHLPFDEKDREIVDGALQALVYILEHKRAEKALRESEVRWKTILKTIQTGIMIIDAETHQILYVNELASDIVGKSQKELEGIVCHQYVCPAETGKCPITDLGQAVDRSARVLLTAAGVRIPIIKSVVPMLLDGRRVLLENFVDIREQKHMEEELQKHLEETEKVNRLMRGRENRILDLKQIINGLLVRLGEPPRYASVSEVESGEKIA